MKMLDYHTSINFINYIVDKKCWLHQVNGEKGKIIIHENPYKKIIEFKFPLVFPEISEDENLADYYTKINLLPLNYIIILIQAGNCALGHFKDKELENHKVIKRYMVRKKQGKAQITYLKEKGKSRLGSRIRLRNSVLFFNNINEVLNNWEKCNKIYHIYYSCTPYLWGLLFRSKVKTPFDKKDTRLKKIPINVNIPNFKQLLYINRLILSGTLHIYCEQYANIFDTLLKD